MSCDNTKLGIVNNMYAKYDPNPSILSQDNELKPILGINKGPLTLLKWNRFMCQQYAHLQTMTLSVVGCFGFNSPLRQYFSLYRAISQRVGERGEKRIDESKNVQTTPTRTYYKRSRPLSYCNPNCRTPRHWKFTQHHGTTRPPPPYLWSCKTIGLKLQELPSRDTHWL